MPGILQPRSLRAALLSMMALSSHLIPCTRISFCSSLYVISMLKYNCCRSQSNLDTAVHLRAVTLCARLRCERNRMSVIYVWYAPSGVRLPYLGLPHVRSSSPLLPQILQRVHPYPRRGRQYYPTIPRIGQVNCNFGIRQVDASSFRLCHFSQLPIDRAVEQSSARAGTRSLTVVPAAIRPQAGLACARSALSALGQRTM